MTAITCTRRLAFDAGHRVVGHEGKCRHLHGHRYEIEVTAAPAAACQNPAGCWSGCSHGDGLDELGRVVDFGIIKQRLGGWVDRMLDHAMLLWAEDPLLKTVCLFDVAPGHKQRVYTLPHNPTAENLAREFGEMVCPTLFAGTGIEVVQVVVHETPNCYATWRVGDR